MYIPPNLIGSSHFAVFASDLFKRFIDLLEKSCASRGVAEKACASRGVADRGRGRSRLLAECGSDVMLHPRTL